MNNLSKFFRAPQDFCWDLSCPTTSTTTKEDKLSCLQSKAQNICECCQNRGLPDCEVLIPDQGMLDPCAMVGQKTAGADVNFCDCLQSTCPNCTAEQYRQKMEDIAKCCQSKCKGGSCNYDCIQYARDYMTSANTIQCPETSAPVKPIITTSNPPTSTSTSSLFSGIGKFFKENNSLLWIITVIIILIIAVMVFGWLMRNNRKNNKKSRKRR